jgi:hypothetical protein
VDRRPNAAKSSGDWRTKGPRQNAEKGLSMRYNWRGKHQESPRKNIGRRELVTALGGQLSLQEYIGCSPEVHKMPAGETPMTKFK